MDDGSGKPGACPISQTVDEKSPKRGMEPEIVTVAVACDRVLAISCGENNGDCFLYDVTDLPNSPVLKQVFNLSPISQNVAPGPAYKARTLGDLDPEATFFAPADKSPTGKAGIFFGGAHSVQCPGGNSNVQVLSPPWSVNLGQALLRVFLRAMGSPPELLLELSSHPLLL